MKHANLEDLQTVATISTASSRPLTRKERLRRWADLLEQRGGEPLSTLVGTEYEPPLRRDRMQADNSALSVAYADPVLRGDGLEGDTYGAAKNYFGLSDWQLHDIICYCHFGATTSAISTSRRVRALAGQWQPNLVQRARRMFAV